MLLLEHQRCELALIVLTYNAEQFIPDLLRAVSRQSRRPDCIVVIDSTSTDRTREQVNEWRIPIYLLPQSEFDHGGTRRFATQLIHSEFYLFLTQDAIPADDSCFEVMLNFMKDSRHQHVGCAYGRQLPRTNAGVLGRHARLFNYPEKSDIKMYSDRHRLGIKTCFNSDSFAMYRQSALFSIGNFPKRLSMAEDMYVAAKMLIRHYAVAYVAESRVYHSHDFSVMEEFRRYVQIGRFHREYPWIRRLFLGINQEGLRYVRSEWAFVIDNEKSFYYFMWSLCSLVAKWAGFRLGMRMCKKMR